MQKNTGIIIAVVALVVGLGVGLGFGYQTNDRGMDMEVTMAGMNAGLTGKTGDTFDQAFLSEMIVHHQGAVEMAQLALTSANHKEIKDLANGIISAQNKEIAEMKAWQKSWFNQ
jgi:uncharacterized protein (DUF305 family)